MGTTAEKITYLNDTKQLLKENINSLGGNLTTEPFRQYASILEGIYERIPKVSGIGSLISLSPTMAGKIKLNEIDGDTLQDGTPTPDTPVEIQSVTGRQEVNICGKNLFDKNNANNLLNNVSINPSNNVISTANGFYTLKIPCKPNTTYTISKVVSSRFIAGYSNNSTYTSGETLEDIINNKTGTTITITTGTNAKLLYVFYSKLSEETTYTLQQILDSIQIEIGSTATEYEPYKGNTYEVNLGKNLISSITKQGNTLKFNGAVANEDYIFKAGTYTFSYTRNISSTISTFIKDTAGTQTSLGTGTTITFTSNFDFNIWLYRSGITTEEASNIQLEKGSTATSYSEYFTPIELNKIGDYQDSIKKSTGKNLFDKSTIKSGYLIQVNGNEVTNTSYGASDYIPVKANTQYTRVNCNNYYGAFYDSNKNFVGAIQNANTITPSVDGYVRISFLLTNVDSVMLNEGSTALTYEPYGEVWYIEKQIGKVVLDGSATENWTLNNNYTNNSRFTENNNILNKTIRDVYCNYFIKGTAGTDTPNIDINGSTGKIMITIPNSLATYTTTLTTWLSTHNTEVLYIMRTPEITEITNTTLIEQLESWYNAKSIDGTTNIMVISENLPAILNVSVLKGDAE